MLLTKVAIVTECHLIIVVKVRRKGTTTTTTKKTLSLNLNFLGYLLDPYSVPVGFSAMPMYPNTMYGTYYPPFIYTDKPQQEEQK